jgi:hypothetical protein
MKKKGKSGKAGKKKRSLKPKRKLGIYGGKFKVPDDFDAPLPKELLDAFEGISDPPDKWKL